MREVNGKAPKLEPGEGIWVVLIGEDHYCSLCEVQCFWDEEERRWRHRNPKTWKQTFGVHTPAPVPFGDEVRLIGTTNEVDAAETVADLPKSVQKRYDKSLRVLRRNRCY